MAAGLNNLQSVNRNTKQGFRKYMERNPYYFKSVFPNMDIEKAWKEVNKLKISNDYPTFEGDITWQE